MEVRRHSQRPRRRHRHQEQHGLGGALLFAGATALVALQQVQTANAAVTVGKRAGGSTHNHLQSRQYPSDAPGCAQLCIRVKIEEAADPGLAPSCDYRTSGYVDCLCASDKFTAAYEQCLLDNCVFPSSLETGRSLFRTFCSGSATGQASQAVSVASSAVASQASVYSRTATASMNTTASSSAATSSGASTSSGPASTSTGSNGSSNTSGATTGTGTGITTTGTNTASQNTQSTLDSAALASARANATGVSAASLSKRPLSTWTVVATSTTLVLLGSLAVLV